ncbi:MAG: type II toxin-antitoxin system RelE/ParE family toxin [Acutalibacteraceae bacterium]
MQKYHVIVSQKAADMLKEHISFLASVNKNAAKNTKARLIEAFHSLEQMPNRFPFFNAEFITPNKYHKMYVENWYLVLYQIKDNDVFIDYVVDCRQGYDWLIK